MIGPAFDVFRKEPDGRVVWSAAVYSMTEAHIAIKVLLSKHAGTTEFLVLNEQTGERIIIKPENLHPNAA